MILRFQTGLQFQVINLPMYPCRRCPQVYLKDKLKANDYQEIGQKRVSPLHFGIAVFYELLYECLKSENYE